jgi:putative inorganic carbon (hco3(-)) transporter
MLMVEQLKLKWFYWLSALFIALSVLFIVNEEYWFLLVPFAVVLGYIIITRMDSIIFLIVLSTPFAVNINESAFKVAFSMPTEPLMFALMIVFFLKVLYEGGFDKKVLRHPVTIAIIINLVWMGITSLTSSMPLVSIKHLTSRLWFVVVFYFLCTQLFKDYSNVKKFVWFYTIPLLGVIGYTIYMHQQNGFTEKSAHWVMTPFYNDHTAYAAAIAMFLPIIVGFTFNKKYSSGIRLASFFVCLALILGLVLSYTRAAWVSILVAFIVYLVFAFRIKFYTVMVSVAALLILFFSFKTQIMMKLEKNRQQSSTDLQTHVASISNISTDASNLERINRWNSALRMFRERPVFGWGPGTYQFKYAPFQRSNELTIISTNAGDRGNAHSEYIGPLAEEGVLGSATFIFLIIVMIYRATLLYTKSVNKEVRLITIGILLGLITYLVHGTLNNFLDTDKASVPFWGFVAILTALDVYHSRKPLNGNGQAEISNGQS